MADKPLEIHDDALAELKSALRWYLERSESAANGFVGRVGPICADIVPPVFDADIN